MAKKMDSYISNSGKKVIIREMASPYLLNSYSYYNNRLEIMKKQLYKNKQILDYFDRLQNQVDSLWSEIERRNLLPTPD
jgi:hypothetical protein